MSLRPLLLAWHPAHLQRPYSEPMPLESVDVVPLNQVAWQAAVECGACVVVRPWEHVDAELLAAVHAQTHQSLQSWQSDARSIALAKGLPENTEHLDAARVWMAYRDWHYCSALLERLTPLLRQTPVLYAPRPPPMLFTSWYRGNDIPALALQALADRPEVSWLPPIHPDALDKASLPYEADSLPYQNWHLVHLLGLTDPVHHVERVLRRDGHVLIAYDRELSGSIDLFKSWSHREHRIHCIELPIGNAVAELHQAAFPPLVHASKDLIGEAAIRELWPRHAQFRLTLDRMLLRHGLPRSVVVSDHASPEGLLILEMARKHGICGESIAHASRVLDSPFRMLPPDTSNWTYFASTRTDRNLARSLLDAGEAEVKIRPSPRFRVGPRRILRMVRRLLAPARRNLRIGIVVTSGEAPLTPDFPVSLLLEQVRSVCGVSGNFKRPLELVFRLREHEDSERLFAEAIGDTCLPATIQRGTAENRRMFYRECDLLIELGSPGTAALESIADGTPVLRLCTGTSADALRCSVQRIMEPLSPWTGDLAIFCNNTFARRRLALLQFLALAGQTMELS